MRNESVLCGCIAPNIGCTFAVPKGAAFWVPPNIEFPVVFAPPPPNMGELPKDDFVPNTLVEVLAAGFPKIEDDCWGELKELPPNGLLCGPKALF